MKRNFFGVSQDDLWCGGWPSISSGTVIIIQVWTWRTSGSWHISNHARELKFGEQTENHIPWWSMRWLLTLSPKYPVRNLQCPPSMYMKVKRILRNFQLYLRARHSIWREVLSKLGVWQSLLIQFFDFFVLKSIYIYVWEKSRNIINICAL